MSQSTTSRATQYHPDWVKAGDTAFEVGVAAAQWAKQYKVTRKEANVVIAARLKQLKFIGRFPKADAASGFNRFMEGSL